MVPGLHASSLPKTFSMRCRCSYLLMAAAICCCLSGCQLPGGYRLASPEDAVVYQPMPYPAGEWEPAGLDFADAWFEAEDGTKLHGWFCEARDPRAVVLICHGNAGNITHRAHLLAMLQKQQQVSVLAFDYRGYGRSAGLPSEDGLIQDARAARAWLAERAAIAEQEVVLLGRSLGGGVAVQLAARDGARGLILESTFTSLPDVAGSMFPFTPVRYLMKHRFHSLAKIDEYDGPLLVIHGDEDRLVPIRQGEALFLAANGPKRFVTINGGDHNWLPTPTYRAELDRFFTELNSPPPSPPGAAPAIAPKQTDTGSM